jgi:hypothetical protein
MGLSNVTCLKLCDILNKYCVRSLSEASDWWGRRVWDIRWRKHRRTRAVGWSEDQSITQAVRVHCVVWERHVKCGVYYWWIDDSIGRGQCECNQLPCENELGRARTKHIWIARSDWKCKYGYYNRSFALTYGSIFSWLFSRLEPPVSPWLIGSRLMSFPSRAVWSLQTVKELLVKVQGNVEWKGVLVLCSFRLSTCYSHHTNTLCFSIANSCLVAGKIASIKNMQCTRCLRGPCFTASESVSWFQVMLLCKQSHCSPKNRSLRNSTLIFLDLQSLPH